MSGDRIHFFSSHDIRKMENDSGISLQAYLGRKLNNPFNYEPSAFAETAAEKVREHVRADAVLAEEASEGKMFGILTVAIENGNRAVLAFLAAFSGNIRTGDDFFVPPVFDLYNQEGFFRKGENEISAINAKFSELKSSPEYIKAVKALRDTETEAGNEISAYSEFARKSKNLRDEIRKSDDYDEKTEEKLLDESRFQKAELKRIRERWKKRISEIAETLSEFDSELERLHIKRKKMSAVLQERIFDGYSFLNGKGERKNLREVFSDHGIAEPPSGAGDCAGPKLFQYAFEKGLRPIEIAEFWYGRPPASGIRHDGSFYPSCQNKCGPILGYMLGKTDMGKNHLADPDRTSGLNLIRKTGILYEDDYLIAADKPAGILSVPGKTSSVSLQEFLQEREKANGKHIYQIHRLDMDTSGVILFAKDEICCKRLQRDFENRKITKTYLALLEGSLNTDGKIIRTELPLSPDIADRPRQKVDTDFGKPALTVTRIICRSDRYTFVEMTPVTGRTHQLRVHAAHGKGLGHPIAGDRLYGFTKAGYVKGRLMLHAYSISFTHPVTGKTMTIKAVNNDFFSYLYKISGINYRNPTLK